MEFPGACAVVQDDGREADMLIHEHFNAAGNWMFRRRGYLPLLIVGLILASMRNFQYLGHSHLIDEYWEIFCLAVCFAGLAIRVLTVGCAPGGTSGRNTAGQRADVLNTSGMYSIVRHPLYLGNFFIWLGLSAFLHDPRTTLVCMLVFVLYYERIMYAEEKFLADRFGTAYREWAERTPAILPRLADWRPAELPFSLRNVLRREYNGLLAIVVTMFLFEAVGDMVYEGKLEVDPLWRVLLPAIFAIWLILRTLKKHTRLLHVPGR
jgi:protein-S-isoprenylcysteine O-methyltransferase Ste14